MTGAPCWEYLEQFGPRSWRTPSSNTGSEFAPGGQAGSVLPHGPPTHWGEGTCGQLMCVTETGAHTGLVLCASANFISDTNSAVVIENTLKSEGICKKAMT